MMPNPATDHNTTRAWLDYLYGHIESGWLTLFAVDRTSENRYTDWFHIDDLDNAANRAIERSSTCCVWFGVATRTERLVGKRGGAEYCAQVPALWIDVDVADDVHAAEELPANRDEAHAIIDAFPIAPTAVIDSGHGLQAWWVLAEAAEATEIASVLPRWNATWQTLAAPRHIDNVFDLPRIMRLPGTLNHKAEPVAVEIIDADWGRLYDLSELDELLEDPPQPKTPRVESRWTGTEGLPGQVFNTTHSGGELLTRMGFELDHTDSSGDHYRRPGKSKGQGSSATVYPDGHTTIWSDTVVTQHPALEVRRPYDPFGLYACVEHDGNFAAAAAELERQGYGTLAPADLPADETLFSPGLRGENTPTPTSAALRIRWVDTYPTNPPPDPDPIIEGLINAGEFTVIGAERGIGKTWLGYNLASLLTTATEPLFGRLTIPISRNVLYLQGELDETQAWVRWRMLHQPGTPFDPVVLPHIAESFDRVAMRVIERRSQVTIDGATHSDTFTDATIDARLEQAIEDHSIDVVIVDPWAVYFGGNENSNDQVEAVLAELRRIGMRRRVAWVILHHFGKSRDQAEPEDLWRGASRLADWAANRVTISRHYSAKQAAERDLTRAEARRFADLHFLRRGAPLDGFSIHLDHSGWWREWVSEGDEGFSRRTTLTRNDVLEALREVGEFTSVRHASEVLGCSPTATKNYLDQLVVDRWITAIPGARNSTIFRLPESVTDDQNPPS